MLGRLGSRISPPRRKYRIYFFFPFYHIGGAEKVHAQVAAASGGNDCIIYFTRKSHNDLFFEDFRRSGCVIKDISAWTDNKWLYFLNLIYRGYITGHINRQKSIVFNGQCNFAYKISPWIKKTTPQVELIHSFNSFSYIRTPFLPFISRTIMISKKRIEDHAVYYEKIGIPASFVEKIQYIPNAVQLPASTTIKKPEPFTVLFVGRGSVEKRIHLVTGIAQQLQKSNADTSFEILGDVSNVIDPSQFEFIRFHGNLSDPQQIAAIYSRASILLLTSDTEGFPLVVIEAMAHGAAIVATPVGDIPLHVHTGINGYLFTQVSNEELIVTEGVNYILELKNNPGQAQKIGENNIRYAREHFSIEKFNHSYHQLFDSLKQIT